MKKLSVALIVSFALLLCTASCTKVVDQVDPNLLSDVDGFPAEYGNLVSVTSLAEYPGWFQLWFEDEAGTIRMVRLNVFAGKMHNDVKVLPRQ